MASDIVKLSGTRPVSYERGVLRGLMLNGGAKAAGCLHQWGSLCALRVDGRREEEGGTRVGTRIAHRPAERVRPARFPQRIFAKKLSYFRG
jgi:hypothetical protein